MEDDPGQDLPPQDGGGLEQVLSKVPAAQLYLQEPGILQPLQPPSTDI